MRVVGIVFLISTMCWFISAQAPRPIGTWVSHLPHQMGRRVCQSQNKIVYATPWSLITIDKKDLSSAFISKVEGLSDVGISEIAMDNYNQQLVIAYNNSNIDFLLQNGRVINIPNLKENISINGDKSINDIYISDDRRMFLATGFGVISFNTSRYVFGSTVIMGLRVNAVREYQGYLYAGTEEGLYRVLLDERLNFSDFTLWEYVSDISPDIEALTEIVDIELSMNRLFVASSKKVYRKAEAEDSFTVFYEESDPEWKVSLLSSSDDQLVIGQSNDRSQSRSLFIDSSGTVQHIDVGCSNVISGIEVDELGRVWYADEFNEIRYTENYKDNCKRITYNSPYYHTVSDIDIKNSQIMACDGGVSDNFQYLFSRQGFYILDDNSWRNYNEFSEPFIKENDLLSFFRIKAHPTEDKVYVGSYWGGLLELSQTDSNFKLFTQDNSSLQGTLGDDARERISGIAFDQEDNLWVTTFGAPRPLNVMTPDGEWYNFAVSSPRELSDITIDNFGYKWCPVAGISGGILVYDSGLDPVDPRDDRQRFINRSNSVLTTNVVNTVSIDREGVVWVGTAEGPVLFDCGGDVFDPECEGVRKKVEEDGIVAFLLADQDIRKIETDGANQKWFGTRNGLFVQSANGENKVAQYNITNSPLFDNFISALAYDGGTGLMYIGTNSGLMAYQTNTRAAALRHRENDVFAYPNPVRPEYKGPIAITGLVEDAEVKITDINGRLVFKTIALGGQAIWNGQDTDGLDVKSGVYLVFSNSKESFSLPGGYVTKILLLR